MKIYQLGIEKMTHQECIRVDASGKAETETEK
jgi:hypothetical protein